MVKRAEEKDLNSLLNTEEIKEPTDVATLAKKAVPTTAPAPAAVVAETPSGYVSLYDFVNQNRTKITNAAVTNISTFSRVPAGKFLLFCTNEEADAELILFEYPNKLWIERGVVPDSIKVETSGIMIKCNNARYYVGKNNVNKVKINNGKVVGMEIIGKAKTEDDVKIETETVRIQDSDVDTIKLHVKRVSPRLYNVVKDATNKDQIKKGIEDFMLKVCDINHLLKIEKELLLSLSI